MEATAVNEVSCIDLVRLMSSMRVCSCVSASAASPTA